MCEIKQKRFSIEQELALLKKDKKETHNALMKEQKRAKSRKAYGEKKYDGDKLALRAAQGRGQMTCNKNNKYINNKKNKLLDQLSEINLPEIILPKFSLNSSFKSSSDVLSISRASIGYSEENFIIENFSLSIGAKERIAIKVIMHQGNQLY